MRSAISILLFFFPIHFIFIKLKNLFYDNNLLRSEKINSTVISVGNISLGGSGKTPFTISLSNFYIKRVFLLVLSQEAMVEKIVVMIFY